MKTLETTFTKGGFAFRQINREGQIALFSKRRDHWPEHQESYEVVIIQQNRAWKAFGRDIPAQESMPASESWGTHGWTFLDLERAKTRFRDLVRTNHDTVLS